MGKKDKFIKQAQVQEKTMLNKVNDIKTIDINLIKLNPFQPRKFFNEESIKELAESIKIDGLLQPILITKDNILIAGERRLRAIKLLGDTVIKAIIFDNADDEKMQTISIIENMQREDLSLYDESFAINELKKMNTDFNIAKKINKSLTYVKKRIKAIKIIEEKDLPKEIFNLNDILEYGKLPIKNNLNKTENKEDLSIKDLNETESSDTNEPNNDNSSDEPNNDNSSDDGLIKEKMNTKDIIEKDKLVNDEKELILFFDEIKNTDFKITNLTNGEVIMRGNKLSFKKIMEKLK
jgi:ParB family chromosome partitioning protein